MPRKIVAIVVAALVGTILAGIQVSTQQQQAPALTISPVKEGLFNIVGSGGNVAALVTPEGVILVDDKFEQNYEGIIDRVKTVTNQPVKYVFNTHYHSDHAGGNVKFAPAAEIISTRNSRQNILDKKQPGAPANMMPARVVFTQETSVFLGGKEVRARFFGRGHTNGDAVIYFPDLRTVHMGDLMAGTSPLIDYNGGGSLIEWTRTLDEVLKLDFDTVIPGHGNVTNKAGLQTYRDNIEKLRTRVTGLIREGKSQADVAAVMTAEYGWAANSLQQQWSVPGMMVELK
jgi:glyoxylase-like metal-dependent hydrolase (beta-lactamase superfamily II)